MIFRLKPPLISWVSVQQLSVYLKQKAIVKSANMVKFLLFYASEVIL